MTTSADDIELLRGTVRDALARMSTSADVRRAMATAQGYETPVWHRLSRELGLPGLTLAPRLGGGGFSAAELAVVFEEAGARLLCAPLFATAGLAVPLLQALADPAALDRYGPPIASGDLTATVALVEASGRWRWDELRCAATRNDAGWTLEGCKEYVLDGASAGLLLVVAVTADGLGVFAVDADAPGLTREQLVTLDQTRKQARLTFHAVPATRLGTGDATAALAHATAVSRALQAAEHTGGAQHCLTMTVEYAKTRIQFGRPIGSFQAVKQRLADCLIQVESARSAAYAAARAAAEDDPDLEHVAAIAALTAAEAYTWVTAQTVQLHGGIGFTWEHDAHLYFKRARAGAFQLGTSAELVDTIGRHLADVLQ